jgi:hypothetical protein
MELMYEKKMNKQLVPSLKQEAIKNQLNKVLLDKQYNTKLFKYKQNKEYKKSTLLMSSSFLKIEPSDNKSKPTKDAVAVIKPIKRKNFLNSSKCKIRIYGKKYMIKQKIDMNEYAYNKGKIIQRIRRKCFVPGRYGDRKAEIIRSKIFSNIEIYPLKFPKPFEVAPKGILGPE